MKFFEPSAVATFATSATESGQTPNLSQLSQLSQPVNAAELPDSVATVAIVATVGSSLEPQSPALTVTVTVWTPAGQAMMIQARDAEHAAFLVTMNPKPKGIEPRQEVRPTGSGGDHQQTLLAYLATIGETDQAIIDELLTECTRDADLMAGVLRQARDVLGLADIDPLDDRRHCHTCQSLVGGYCRSRRYRPVDDIPRRCIDYQPRAT